MPPAEVTTDAEYVELAMTNGAGATAAADLEEPSVLAGVLGIGCEAGAAIGVVVTADFTDCGTVEATLVTVEAVLTFAVTEEDSDWGGFAAGAESTCDVEVSVR